MEGSARHKGCQILKDISLIIILMVLCISRASGQVFVPHYPDFFEQYTKQNHFDIDTAADAVVLYEKTEYAIVVMGPVYVFRKQVRKIIKILTDKGKGYGDIQDRAYYNGRKNTDINSISATTYNWQGGIITEDRLDKKTVGYEMASDSFINLNFSMPSVHTGSVIDYQYAIEQPWSYSLGTIYLRERIPKLYCEVTLEVPYKYDVTCLLHTTLNFEEYDDETGNRQSVAPRAYKNTKKINKVNTVNRWVVRDMPGAPDEPYVSNVKKLPGPDVLPDQRCCSIL